MSRFKKIPVRLISMLLMTLMLCSILPFSAFAADTTLTVKFGILYISDEFNIGYDYENVGTEYLPCQFTTCGGGEYYEAHGVAFSAIGTARNTYANRLRDGYEIVGWASTDTPNANVQINAKWYGSGVANSATFYPGRTIYLVAKKPVENYTLSYNANGGTNAPAAETKSGSGSAIFTVSSVVPTYEGYTFKGWALNAEATTAEYPANASITITGNTTLYAVWEEAGTVPPVDPTPDTGDEEKVSKSGMDKKNGDEDTLGTVEPGTVFDFTLNSHIGNDLIDEITAHLNGEYEGTYTLVFHDKMENLSFVDNSLSVKVGNITLNPDQYTLTTACTDGCDFEVSIDCIALLNDEVFELEDAGTIPVTVAYQAMVAEDATYGTLIKNSAWVNDSAVDILEGDVDDTIPTPPATGGNGTVMYTVLGVVLMGVAAIAYAVSRKKRSVH